MGVEGSSSPLTDWLGVRSAAASSRGSPVDSSSIDAARGFSGVSLTVSVPVSVPVSFAVSFTVSLTVSFTASARDSTADLSSSTSASLSSRTLSSGLLALARPAASLQSMPSVMPPAMPLPIASLKPLGELSAEPSVGSFSPFSTSCSRRSFSYASHTIVMPTISLVSTSISSLSFAVMVVMKGSFSNSPAEGRVGALAISRRMNAFASSSLTSFRHSGNSP